MDLWCFHALIAAGTEATVALLTTDLWKIKFTENRIDHDLYRNIYHLGTTIPIFVPTLIRDHDKSTRRTTSFTFVIEVRQVRLDLAQKCQRLRPHVLGDNRHLCNLQELTEVLE